MYKCHVTFSGIQIYALRNELSFIGIDVNIGLCLGYFEIQEASFELCLSYLKLIYDCYVIMLLAR